MIRAILAILILLVVIVIAAVATNFIDIRTTGELKAPSLSVQGGELPQVNVDTKKVVLESRESTVPTVETSTTNVEVPVVRSEER